MALVRIQVLVEEDENEALTAEARRLGLSRSEVVRRELRRLVRRPRKSRDPFLAFLDSLPKEPGGDEGPTDGSIHHDTYLYGDEMRP